MLKPNERQAPHRGLWRSLLVAYFGRFGLVYAAGLRMDEGETAPVRAGLFDRCISEPAHRSRRPLGVALQAPRVSPAASAERTEPDGAPGAGMYSVAGGQYLEHADHRLAS